MNVAQAAASRIKIPGAPGIFILLAAACATFIACGVCVMFVTAYVYFYLSHHDF